MTVVEENMSEQDLLAAYPVERFVSLAGIHYKLV